MSAEKRNIKLHHSGNKVFCIGFNKTGTHSLHNFFKSSGLKSLHDPNWPYYSKISYGHFFFYLYQCYSDGEQCDFVRLQHWFKRSVFILNNRDEKEWLRSRVKHVLRYNEEMGREIIHSKKYGDMAKQFVYGKSDCIFKWVVERRIYIDQVREFFKYRKNFLEIDITTHPNWQARISKFLEENRIKKNINLDNYKTLHENSRPDVFINDSDLLMKYYIIIDEILKKAAR